ncbi:MAG: prenyltransferase [Gammaproteobacteria bacterium]
MLPKKKIVTLIKTARPAFLLLTPSCLSVAFAFAIYQGIEIAPVKALLILLGALSAHVSVNMLNEYTDFTSGLDLHTQRTPFSGGSGGLPGYPEAAEPVFLVGLLCLTFTTLIGLYLVWHAGLGLLPIGVAGILLIYFYSPQITRRPLLCLLAPGLGFGPFMILGANYLLSGHYQPGVLATAFIVLFIVSNLLLLNQFPDLDADREAGRRNVPIWLGRKKAAWVYVGFMIIAYGMLLLSVYLNILPIFSLMGMITLFLAIPAARLALKNYDDMARLEPALGLNVALTLSLPLLISLGLVWQKLW